MMHGSMKRWLVASLVLNLFLACGIAGGAWRWWSVQRAGGDAVATAQQRGLRFAADDLSAEQRRAYRIGLRDARRDMAAQLSTAREGRQEVLRLLAAPQLDNAAVAQALARTREADSAVRTRVETSVAQFAAGLSREDRQKLAGGLARRSAMGGPATAPQATTPPQ